WDATWSALLIAPFLMLDLFFFGANILRVTEGGWVPLLVAGLVGIVIVSWLKGRRAAQLRTSQQGVSMDDLAKALAARPPVRI
ncbi:KUP/HAK/KT family potassium transporter, partial [Acinetobacter baumannii]